VSLQAETHFSVYPIWTAAIAHGNNNPFLTALHYGKDCLLDREDRSVQDRVRDRLVLPALPTRRKLLNGIMAQDIPHV
jgi:hypothetical protein